MIYKLSDLCRGEKATVLQIDPACNIRTRFLRLGLITNEPVVCIAVAPGGDPKAFMIKDAVICIRNGDSASVAVKKEGV